MKTWGCSRCRAISRRTAKRSSARGRGAVEVRSAAQMAHCDGLILPGGESSTMLKLLDIEELLEPLRRFGAAKPIYGTCAGAILLAHEVTHPVAGEPRSDGYCRRAQRLRTADRQPDREGLVTRANRRRVRGGIHPRADYPTRWARMRVLRAYQGDPVWVEQGRHMVTTFHPELTDDPRIHRRFVEKL